MRLGIKMAGAVVLTGALLMAVGANHSTIESPTYKINENISVASRYIPTKAHTKAITSKTDRYVRTNEPSIHDRLNDVIAYAAEAQAYKVEVSDLVFIGDSNTVRMSLYTDRLTDAMHVSAICGVNSKGWDSFTSDNDTTNGKTLKADLDGIPSEYFSHIVIMLGTNDYKKGQEEFTEGYTKILDYIKSRNPNSIVNMVTIPPVNDSSSYSIKDKDADKINEFIVHIANTYEGLSINLVDLNSHLSVYDMSTGDADGYHLSRDGAVKAADFIIDNAN